MLKKITFGGLFLFVTLLVSSAQLSSTTKVDPAPRAPVGQGMCYGRC